VTLWRPATAWTRAPSPPSARRAPWSFAASTTSDRWTATARSPRAVRQTTRRAGGPTGASAIARKGCPSWSTASASARLRLDGLQQRAEQPERDDVPHGDRVVGARGPRHAGDRVERDPHRRGPHPADDRRALADRGPAPEMEEPGQPEAGPLVRTDLGQALPGLEVISC
jgi:hypothetical protein